MKNNNHEKPTFCQRRLISMKSVWQQISLESVMQLVLSLTIISIIIVLSISYLISQIGYAELAKNLYIPIVKLIRLMHENWKSLIIILIPLFYQEIKCLILRIEQIGPLKVQKPNPHPIPPKSEMEKILEEEEDNV